MTMTLAEKAAAAERQWEQDRVNEARWAVASQIRRFGGTPTLKAALDYLSGRPSFEDIEAAHSMLRCHRRLEGSDRGLDYALGCLGEILGPEYA